MEFEFPEDERFYHSYLCNSGESLEKYKSLFDFRLPKNKRAEFNKQRNLLLNSLIEIYKHRCQLRYEGICDEQSGWVIDHLIPLSSNKLNKTLRNLSGVAGKKVAAQSFGSNHPNNLILACANCNNHKKHSFLEQEQMRYILQSKKFDR